ncbi:MAG: MFS transporter [Candidatus Bipolaricaulia bacterium]
MVAQKAERDARGQGLLPLMLGHFTNDIYSNFLPAYIPPLIAKFSLSLTLAGAASSVYTMASSFTQLLFGYAGDRLKITRFVLITPLITAVFMSSVGAMPSYLLVLCLLIFAALGTATFHPWATPLAGGLSGRGKGTSISLFIAAGSLGFALGPLAATGFISFAGFGRTYLLALPALLVAAILIKKIRLPEGPPETELPRPSPLRSLIPILPLGLIVILRSTVQMAISTFLLVLLEERELSHLAGSFVLGAFLIMGTVGTLLGGYLSDRLGRRPITALSLALAYPLYWGFLSTSGLFSFLLLALAGALAAASNPVLVTQAQELAPGHAGIASALTMGFGWGIAGLLISLVGWMGDLFGLSASLRWTILALPLAAAVSLGTREA